MSVLDALYYAALVIAWSPLWIPIVVGLLIWATRTRVSDWDTAELADDTALEQSHHADTRPGTDQAALDTCRAIWASGTANRRNTTRGTQ